MVKSSSRQGKHTEFENIFTESLNQESMHRKNCYVTSMVLYLMFKMLSFYYENTQGKLKLHREITGKTQGILPSEMSGNHVYGRSGFG